jgi:multiple sugar transport system permease protein
MTRRRRRGRGILGAAVVLAAAAVTLGPLATVLLTAFTDPVRFARDGLGVPTPPTLANFAVLLADPDVLVRPMLTTLAVATILAIVQTTTAVLAAYVFTRLTFRGRDVLFAIYLASYLAPPVVTFLPLYAAFATAGLAGTFWALVLPFALASPYAILLLRQAFRAVPRDVLDAAELDGAGHGTVLRRIVLPLTRPVVATVVLVAAISAWNSYLWPRLAAGVRFPQVQVAIGSLQSQYDSNWTLVMAGTVLAVLPPIAAAILLQRPLRRTLDLQTAGS